MFGLLWFWVFCKNVKCWAGAFIESDGSSKWEWLSGSQHISMMVKLPQGISLVFIADPAEDPSPFSSISWEVRSLGTASARVTEVWGSVRFGVLPKAVVDFPLIDRVFQTPSSALMFL